MDDLKTFGLVVGAVLVAYTLKNKISAVRRITGA